MLSFLCAGMSKQNYREQVSVCLENNEVHNTKRVKTLQKVTWVTDTEML